MGNGRGNFRKVKIAYDACLASVACGRCIWRIPALTTKQLRLVPICSDPVPPPTKHHHSSRTVVTVACAALTLRRGKPHFWSTVQGSTFSQEKRHPL